MTHLQIGLFTLACLVALWKIFQCHVLETERNEAREAEQRAQANYTALMGTREQMRLYRERRTMDKGLKRLSRLVKRLRKERDHEKAIKEFAMREDSDEIDRLRRLVIQGQQVVEDFMPNIGKCVLQDYARLNKFLVDASKEHDSCSVCKGYKGGVPGNENVLPDGTILCDYCHAATIVNVTREVTKATT